MSKGTHPDWLGRFLGCGVFLLGIGVLALVFYFSYHLFQKSPQELFGGNPRSHTPNMTQLLQGLFAGLYRLVLLIVMAIVGGMIANRGIRMYLSVRLREEEGKELPPTTS